MKKMDKKVDSPKGKIVLFTGYEVEYKEGQEDRLAKAIIGEIVLSQAKEVQNIKTLIGLIFTVGKDECNRICSTYSIPNNVLLPAIIRNLDEVIEGGFSKYYERKNSKDSTPEVKRGSKEMKTRVVNISSKEPYDVYIGRANRWKKLKKSPFANPFAVGKDGTREEVIKKYREWFLSQPELVEQARKELKGKVLGCWCKPEPCHGDVIAEVVDGGK